VVVNERDAGAVEAALRAEPPPIPVELLRRTTASSLETFSLVAERLRAESRALVAMVDGVFEPGAARRFGRAARALGEEDDGLIGVTDRRDEDRPLRVALDPEGRILAIGPGAEGSPWATAGLYLLPARAFALAPGALAEGLGALRHLLARLVPAGLRLRAERLGAVVDVDRPDDVAAAERLAPLLAGVTREPVYSPGRFLEADRAILEETARACEARGARVRILPPDAPLEAFEGARLVFTMCQGPKALATLRSLVASGTTVVHEPEAIEACHRTRMLPLLAAAGLPRPEAVAVECAHPAPAALAFAEELAEAGVWVKRGDVHATRPEDVVRVHGAGETRRALARLAEAGVPRAVLEAHVPGRTIKFYGVRATGFFRAYAADGEEIAQAPPAWAALAERAAAALGLAVYGGDLVVDDAGAARVVDVNDWPSFSLCRQAAAAAIAEHLLSRLPAAP